MQWNSISELNLVQLNPAPLTFIYMQYSIHSDLWHNMEENNFFYFHFIIFSTVAQGFPTVALELPSQSFYVPQNILLYEYVSSQYIKT